MKSGQSLGVNNMHRESVKSHAREKLRVNRDKSFQEL